ncbi:hypothetical protein [Derxia gummosa]|uniref:Uncharacterized protein n=1 Tax=Derxia gummosa DSM 723 TaxID=1121388 RepID=A0A8B6X401_9BURK|nr:hypothetical protein [Derxia gummosa]
MNSIEALDSLMHAEAVDASGDTHLPKGIHLRVLPAPEIGLPCAPFAVWRDTLAPELLAGLAVLNDVTWLDSDGKPLQPPFSVTPGKPVTAHFPAGPVVWAQVDVATSTAKPGSPSSLVAEALGHTGAGIGVLQRRDRLPLVLAARDIQKVRVSGSGTVIGLRWVQKSRLPELPDPRRQPPWRWWSLPVQPSDRYQPLPTALADAEARLRNGAPTRLPLHLAPTASGPAAAPASTPAAAWARSAAARKTLAGWLAELLGNHNAGKAVSQIPLTQEMAGHSAELPRRLSLPLERFALTTALEPDIGRWLGFGDVDVEGAALPAGTLLRYVVRGLWTWPTPANEGEQMLWATLGQGRRASLAAAAAAFPELVQQACLPKREQAYFDMHAECYALSGQPSAAPGAPVFTLAEHRAWMPTGIDTPTRSVRLQAAGFVPGALAAFAATDKNGKHRLLNPCAPAGEGGQARAIVVQRPPEAVTPDIGRFQDSAAAPDSTTWRLAQGDWFGRWSGWGKTTAIAPARPRPPQAAIELHVLPVDPDTLIGQTGPLAARLRVEIPLPADDDLPPGARRLKTLSLTEQFDGQPAQTLLFDLTTVRLAPAGAPAYVRQPAAPAQGEAPPPSQPLVVVLRDGPALPPGGSSSVSYVARWLDEQNQPSASDSPPCRRGLVDPRPEASPDLPARLLFTPRPDADGKARIAFGFKAQAGRRYRVFGASEPVLVAGLRRLAAQGDSRAATALAAMADLPAPAGSGLPPRPRPLSDRANALDSVADLLGWDFLESLTPAPLEPVDGVVRFEQRVSGSLRALMVFRVVAEGASGALAPIGSTPLLKFAVTNFGAPARPLVSLARDDAGQRRLRVRVPPGTVAVAGWRLRMSSTPTAEPRRMAIVAQGTAQIAAGADGDAASFDIALPGGLKPWRRYRFVVELQAGPPPGSYEAVQLDGFGSFTPPVGDWSEPGAPVVLGTEPADRPLAPTQTQLDLLPGSGCHLTLLHPQAASLLPNSFGAHRFDTVLDRAGAAAEPLALDWRLDAASGVWSAEHATGLPADATGYAVVIVDPLGRRSDPVRISANA